MFFYFRHKYIFFLSVSWTWRLLHFEIVDLHEQEIFMLQTLPRGIFRRHSKYWYREKMKFLFLHFCFESIDGQKSRVWKSSNRRKVFERNANWKYGGKYWRKIGLRVEKPKKLLDRNYRVFYKKFSALLWLLLTSSMSPHLVSNSFVNVFGNWNESLHFFLLFHWNVSRLSGRFMWCQACV